MQSLPFSISGMQACWTAVGRLTAIAARDARSQGVTLRDAKVLGLDSDFALAMSSGASGSGGVACEVFFLILDMDSIGACTTDSASSSTESFEILRRFEGRGDCSSSSMSSEAEFEEESLEKEPCSGDDDLSFEGAIRMAIEDFCLGSR